MNRFKEGLQANWPVLMAIIFVAFMCVGASYSNRSAHQCLRTKDCTLLDFQVAYEEASSVSPEEASRLTPLYHERWRQEASGLNVGNAMYLNGYKSQFPGLTWEEAGVSQQRFAATWKAMEIATAKQKLAHLALDGDAIRLHNRAYIDHVRSKYHLAGLEAGK